MVGLTSFIDTHPDVAARVDAFCKAAVGREITTSPRCQAGYIADTEIARVYVERAFSEAIAINNEETDSRIPNSLTTQQALVAALDHLEPQVR